MNTDGFLIEKEERLFESSTRLGDSSDWTNQDFVILSEKILERAGVALSHEISFFLSILLLSKVLQVDPLFL